MRLIKIQHGVAVETPQASALPIRHVIGVGLNYKAHAEEQGKDLPAHPMLFTKNPAACSLSGDEIVVPNVCQDESTGGGGDGRSRGQVDWEAELAVVIGEPARDIPEDAALDVVLGFTAANDVSARWWQKKGSGGQFNRGKSFDTFCPLGPELIAPGDLGNEQSLRLSARVNGEVMQDSTTADMIFSVKHLIAELSKGTTLLPGTVILTGTPGGVGMHRSPPIYLQEGDKVEIEIENIGVLTNTVRWE